MTFHLKCVHIIFSSVWVAEWAPFVKELLTRLTICFLRIFPGLEGWIWVLIASVPGVCILFTFTDEEALIAKNRSMTHLLSH